MAGIYRQRHPEHTVFYRVLFHYFERFLAEYENRFEREYGYLCPVIQEVFSLLLREKLTGLSLVHKTLRWRHSGFKVLNRIRATSKRKVENCKAFALSR